MTTPTVRNTKARHPRSIRTVAASCLVGLLVGAGATGLIVGDPASGEPSAVFTSNANRPNAEAPIAERLAQEDAAARAWMREELRAAVQRCILGPNTPEAAQRCLDGLRLQG